MMRLSWRVRLQTGLSDITVDVDGSKAGRHQDVAKG